ncbi:hypothetical protein VM1G_08278 [Cytospora mali]|uniref:Uncharacterized protein n=1 Tax=Cytospora mali TaxID=578113 RepID=A0A194WA44_CYTMA|nr:hypothetical protein VM1G_08278 [Valsa mali]
MGKLFVKIKNIFSRSKAQEPYPANVSTSSSSISHEPSETTAPSYYHAAASQPPAYQSLPSQPNPPASSHSQTPPTTFQQQAREIAKIQVGGLRRNPGAGGASSYFTSYVPTQPTGPPSSAWKQKTDQNAEPSYNRGGINAASDEKDMRFNADGTAKGSNVTHYNTQSPSEDDEDMWARLAM